MRIAVTAVISAMFLLSLGVARLDASPPLPIPDKLVVLTFDDGRKVDVNNIAPILKRYGFGASFYITEGLRTAEWTDENYFITWPEVKQLHDDGFEIGNHTASHGSFAIGYPNGDGVYPNVPLSKSQVHAELEQIENRCQEYGIPVPTTFTYPYCSYTDDALEVLEERGYNLARRGVWPESETQPHGVAYDPLVHDPMLIPTTYVHLLENTWEDFVLGVSKAQAGKISVLNYHGVPDDRWLFQSTPLDVFEDQMEYLHQNGYQVIAMRDLAPYVYETPEPSSLVLLGTGLLGLLTYFRSRTKENYP